MTQRLALVLGLVGVFGMMGFLMKLGGCVKDMVWTVVTFYRVLFKLWRRGEGGSLKATREAFPSLTQQEMVYLYSLSIIPFLWDTPHYRRGTFREDGVANLKNVAIPGTGIPLSYVAYTRVGFYLFLLAGVPLITFVAAIVEARTMTSSLGEVATAFRKHLLGPDDWFSRWRMNCRVASLHAAVTGCEEYALEDKLAFLDAAEDAGLAVTPSLSVEKLIVKHRNEEGGLGFHAFTNAKSGGDWIIQPAIKNSDALNTLLPQNAPLSTFRVVTSSRGGVPRDDLSMAPEVPRSAIKALSCVWRAGREGAATDHSSILFDVDVENRVFGDGSVNAGWYELGPRALWTTPFRNDEVMGIHLDSGVQVTGTPLERAQDIVDMAADFHHMLIPHLPFAGWDVAFVEGGELQILELNASCNFFQGHVDQDEYTRVLWEYFEGCDGSVH